MTQNFKDKNVGNCTVCGYRFDPEATFSYVKNNEGTGYECYKHNLE